MNLFAGNCILVPLLCLLAMLLEIIETGETYKLIRPYKYYQPRPWRRQRWHTGRKSKFYNSKRPSPDDYYSPRPSYHRHGSEYEDVDTERDGQPYTIVIQLAKDKLIPSTYLERKRKYERDSVPVYSSESEYIDDEEESESRVLNVNDKKVRIKMVKGENPQLQIKISRSDDGHNIELIDKSNITTTDSSLSSKT